jgi:hypothetical protein
MVAHWARGGTVCTNVEIKWPNIVDYISKRWGVIPVPQQCIKLDNEQIGSFYLHTPSGTPDLSVLVVVDEAHLYFNARDHAATHKNLRETLSFLTQSRKVYTDIIFISQSILNMDGQFRRLVQYIWRFRDLSKWKIPGLGVRYPFQQILCVQFDYDGTTVLNRQFAQKDTRIFDLYDTNALVSTFVRLEDVKTKFDLQKVEKPKMKFLLPIGIIFGVICAFVLYKKVSNIGTPKQPPAASSSATATPTDPNKARSVNATNNQDKQTQAQYEIYTENFLAWNGVDKALSTKEGGWYQVGEMSSRGYVTAVSDRRARVAQPDGRTGWIVATRTEKSQEPPTVVAQPSPFEARSEEAQRAIITTPNAGLFPPSRSLFPDQTGEKPPEVIEVPNQKLNDNDLRALRDYKTGRRPTLNQVGGERGL